MKTSAVLLFALVFVAAAQWSSDPSANLLVSSPADPAGSALIALGVVFPNPLASVATVPFSVTGGGFVSLGLFDLTGRVVCLAADGFYPAGNHTSIIDTGEIPSGVYILRLEAMGESVSRASVLLR